MVTADARPLEVQQIQAFLKTQFNGAIVGTGNAPMDRERNFLSKALAAHFLMAHAGASKAEAVAASIDGGNDHGIDSVYISATGVFWLVQSKYIHEGKGEPSLGDVSKFKDGVKDFAAAKFDRFNQALVARVPEIRSAMDRPHAIRFALVYTGTSLNEDRIQLFSDVEEGLNLVQPDRARFVRFGLFDFHDSITAKRAEQRIPPTVIELRNYGLIERPTRAFYGVMRVRDLAELYQKHDHALVRENIRRYRGSSSVNAEITRTLLEAPENFVYFNNGVTLLCERITAVGATDAERRRGRFRLEGVSIINGAQTAGTVAQQPLAHYDTHPADVLVTCIQSSGEQAGFGDRVTEYRNNQNAVRVQDFIALDDNQENWRRTLKASGVTYIYKPSAQDPHAAERIFTAQEAVNYLACASKDGKYWATLVGWVMSGSSLLWEQKRNLEGKAVKPVEDSVYGRLFTGSLTARRLWRTTQLGRMVRELVEADAQTLPSEEGALQKAAVFLIVHLVFSRLHRLCDGVTLMLTRAERDAVSQEAEKVREALAQAYGQEDWGGQEPAAVLADPSNLQYLKRQVMAALAA
ncbi:AIPR family protein [Acidovorax sp. SUPP950]|uniref:AIPR family protein n=1 Tax=Acidovorax sp. SUPP950 TaxID=511901 RepID=UPI0023BDB387|nr:AIPR family protein [Acidovorax sp. SUPP950]GKS77899.1 AIPR family protein [Acidovorax sp. SUPP950]